MKGDGQYVYMGVGSCPEFGNHWKSHEINTWIVYDSNLIQSQLVLHIWISFSNLLLTESSSLEIVQQCGPQKQRLRLSHASKPWSCTSFGWESTRSMRILSKEDEQWYPYHHMIQVGRLGSSFGLWCICPGLLVAGCSQKWKLLTSLT